MSAHSFFTVITATPIFLGALSLAQDCTAQRPNRRFDDYAVGSWNVQWPGYSSPSDVVKITRWVQDASDSIVKDGPISSVPVLMDLRGDIDMNIANDELLLCGAGNDGSGRITILERDPGSLQYAVRETRSYPGRDFVGITAIDGKLYILDSAHQELLSGDYSPGSCLPQSFALIANSATVPPLALTSLFRLTRLESQAGNASLMLNRLDDLENSTRFRVDVDSSGVVSYTIFGGDDLAASIDEVVQPSATHVKVRAPIGVQVEVLDSQAGTANPQVIGGPTAVDASGVAIVSIPSVGLDCVLSARSSAVPQYTQRYHVPEFRFGSAESYTGHWTIQPMMEIGLTSYVGNSNFGVPLVIDNHEVPATPRQLPAYLLVGILGTHPVDVSTGRAILVTGWHMATGVELPSKDAPGVTAVRLPIGEDENLAGNVILYQWVVFDDLEWRVSNIAGITVQPSPWSPFDLDMLLAEDESQASSAARSESPTVRVRVNRQRTDRAAIRAAELWVWNHATRVGDRLKTAIPPLRH